MKRRTLTLAVVSSVGALLAASGPMAGATGPAASTATAQTPRWVLHVSNYTGGISNGVRQALAAQAGGASSAAKPLVAAVSSGPNVQMNNDSNPPLPQNETAVAVSLADPMVAVAASNDYVSGGVAVMRTSDGGRHWLTTRITPQFRGTGDFCSGGDPGVAYSQRDHAFYLTQLCFFRALPFSEVQLYKSVDNGKTWTPGRQAARAASNFDYTTGAVDESVFNDKELVAVDNTATSPHYGRIYITFTKFHILPSGASDYCPLQLSYTDSVPTSDPSLTTFRHTAIQPDAPGSHGVGSSANQFSVPQVEKSGVLDVGFVSEDCNDSFDPHLLFQKSTNGGSSFLPHAVQIDKAGQYKDFLDAAKDDTIPPTAFRAPNTPSLAYSPTTGTLLYVYQNNVNRPTSAADISYQLSVDGGLHWSAAKFLSTSSGATPARNDQFFPWAASDENGVFQVIWFDRRLDPANVRINTWQATSTDDGHTFTSGRISTEDWNPNRGFFTSGAFIGDYNGLAASARAVYPVWTDGRNNAFGTTGIGETDIFTNVEIH